MRNANASLVAATLAVGLVFALPLAGALSWGTDAQKGVWDLKSAGAAPTYGQTWVGLWTKQPYGWENFEKELRALRDAGITPVVMWYYWGDSITVNCVQYGCDGRTKGDWDWMAGELARRGNAIMGSRAWFVVLEPEFNKGGISDWETFDGYLESQAWSIRGKAPSAKVVVGFGHWGGWDKFDRTVAASHHVGFQILRGSTRDSASQAENAAGDLVRIGKELKTRWGKSVLVYDLGIATYGGWEGVQERALKNIAARKAEIEAAGVFGIVWRYVHDNDYSSGYYGPAESSWGVISKSGWKKPAYDDLVALVKGGSSSASTSTGTSPATAAGGAFSDVKGNEWWVQAKVAGSPRSVAARVNGGAWVALSWHSWGAWAVSTHAPTGSTVELKATYGDGTTASASYRWPDAVPTDGSTPSGSFTASFWGVKGNAWWVQGSVSGTKPIATVAARVNGGPWVTLTKYDWGWAKGMSAPAGSRVELQATATTGETARSTTYTWSG
ncbi:MAG TPA: hypothetical protein VNX21_08875 [Candidatus Thermoplasmatota archaeon]|nr:hypothetical protein [Candidatus Thermoplasmatota archaeon]